MIRRPLLNRLPNGLTAKGLNGENDEMMTQRIRMMNTHTRKSRNRERKTYDTIKSGIKLNQRLRKRYHVIMDIAFIHE